MNFGRFATAAADNAGRAWAFCAAVLIVVLWLPTLLLIHDIDTWQLIINTLTTIITFLMVFLIQHTQNRDTHEMKVMLECITDALGLGAQKEAEMAERGNDGT